MRPLGYVIAFCVMCAVIKAVAMALVLGIVLALVIGACTRPRETFGLLAFLLIANLIEKQPLVLLATIALLAIASIARKKAV